VLYNAHARGDSGVILSSIVSAFTLEVYYDADA